MLVKELDCLILSSIRDTASVDEALQIMKRDSTGYLLVKCVDNGMPEVVTWDSVLEALKNSVSLTEPVTRISRKNFGTIEGNRPIDEVDFEENNFFVVLGEKDSVLGILTKEAFLEYKIKSLKAERDMLSQIIEYSPNCIYVADEKGNTVLANKAWEELSDIKRNDVLGMSIDVIEKMKLYYPALTPLILKEKKKIVDSSKVFERENNTCHWGADI